MPLLAPNTSYAPIPAPYQTDLDVALEIEKARYQCRETGKRLLLHIGANWCPDAQALAGMMQIPQIMQYIAEHFIEVAFEIGAERTPALYDRNTDIPARYGIQQLSGVPTLLIVTTDNTVINATEADIFRNARDRDPQDILDYLVKYTPATDMEA